MMGCCVVTAVLQQCTIFTMLWSRHTASSFAVNDPGRVYADVYNRLYPESSSGFLMKKPKVSKETLGMHV
jgi:hypothetical protein